jgi:hypothetical protein
MKKDVVMYKNGSFVDFQGVTRQFVVCALSTSQFNNDKQEVSIVAYDENGYALGETESPRAVFIGISVCNPLDEWNEEKGKMIALAKARGFKAEAPEKSSALFATRAGLISEGVVKALLDREVQHVIDAPGSAIKGYEQMKSRWEENQQIKKYIEETPENLKNLCDEISKLPDDQLERVINVALLQANE